jgi:hypothetical protein
MPPWPEIGLSMVAANVEVTIKQAKDGTFAANVDCDFAMRRTDSSPADEEFPVSFPLYYDDEAAPRVTSFNVTAAEITWDFKSAKPVEDIRLAVTPARSDLQPGNHAATLPGLQADLDRQSVLAFVQDFYDWYIPTARGERGMSGARLVWTYKRSLFSQDLLHALKEDADAQARSPHELVGLDFDPFLNAQDLAERYVAQEVVRQGDAFRVEVHSVWSGQESTEPAVVPELVQRNGHWLFVNFHYGKSDSSDDETLLATLKSLRDHRRMRHR